MKRMLLILMTFVIALNLAACGGNSAPAQTGATETAPAGPAAGRGAERDLKPTTGCGESPRSRVSFCAAA